MNDPTDNSHVAPAAPPRRQFSLAEANRALVLVRRIVEDIVGDYRDLTEMQELMDLAEAQGQHGRARAGRVGLLRLAERIWACLEELDEIGVELKDSCAGVVDFPSVDNGRAISFCWRHGEDRIAHWHEADADFAERRPVESLLTWRRADRALAH